MTDELLTGREVRAILRVEANALTRYLVTIPHLRLGNPRTGPVRVRRADLEAWMERRIVTPEEAQDDEGIRQRQPAPAQQRRAMDRKTPGRKGRAPLLHGDGRGGRAPEAGRGTPGAGPDDLRYPRGDKAA